MSLPKLYSGHWSSALLAAWKTILLFNGLELGLFIASRVRRADQLYNHKKAVTHLSSGSQNDPLKSVKLSTLHNESLTSCSSLLMREDSRVSITKNSEVQPYDSDRVSCLF